MKLEITEAEAAVIDGALVLAHSEYERAARAFRTRAPRLREKYADKITVADGLRFKLLVSQYGAERAAEIAAERATVPALEELYNGEPANLSGGETGVAAGADGRTVAPSPVGRSDAAQGAAADRDAANPSGMTCKGTRETVPFCNGVNCPEWGDCHGDRLRGYTVPEYKGA